MPKPKPAAAEQKLPVAASVEPATDTSRFSVAKRIAETLALSNLTPEAYRGKPADIFVAIQMGHSIGLDPFQAIQSIAVIDSKPCLYGDGLIGVVRSSPLCEYILETIEGETAFCETKRRGDPKPIVRQFSFEDARRAGLDVRPTWRKFPARMLQMRARAWCLRDAYPDVLKGLRVVEEVIDFNTEPAPITEFDLPTASQETVAIEKPVTLKDVQDAITKAKDMPELIKAGDMAKKLTTESDIKTARGAYADRRTALRDAKKESE
jgi:hypothetical protein